MAKGTTRAALLFVVALALVALCGCSFVGAPATTEELLVRYVANESVNDFNMKAEADLNVAALGVHAKIPVSLDFDAAQNVAHGIMTIDLSSLDTRDYSMELYVEQEGQSIVCFLSSLTEDAKPSTWKRYTIDTTSSIDIFTLTNLLKESELTTIAKDSDKEVAYELAVPSRAVLQTAFGLLKDSVNFAGMDEQGFLDMVGTDKVRVDFTADCLLRSFSTGIMANLKGKETNNVSIKVSLDVSAVFDDYGTIDPQKTAVPKEVQENAEPTDEPIDVLEIIGADSPLAGAIAQ